MEGVLGGNGRGEPQHRLGARVEVGANVQVHLASRISLVRIGNDAPHPKRLGTRPASIRRAPPSGIPTALGRAHRTWEGGGDAGRHGSGERRVGNGDGRGVEGGSPAVSKGNGCAGAGVAVQKGLDEGT
eukprot:scaffold17809_cov56-Isochrysis_galbana.AAC.1